MPEFLKYALSDTPALIMYLIGTGVLMWAIYMSYKMVKNQFKVDQSIYLPYCLYAFFIACWIYANAYFQSDLLTYYDPDIALAMAVGANIFCALAILSAYWFSCKLISKNKNKNISKLQSVILIVLSAHSLVVNLIPDMTVISVDVYSSGSFLIRFGDYNKIFFLTAPFIIVLTFLNFVRAWKSDLRLTQLKSGYMMAGVIIFMASTLIVMIGIPYFYNDFSLVWIAPTLSVFELMLIGYALLYNRFYSGRYIALVSISSLTNIALFLSPTLLLSSIGSYQSVALLGWVVFTGLFYQKSLKKVYWFFNRVLYGKSGNSIDQISSLESEFRYSCKDAVEKLNQALNVSNGHVRQIITEKDSQVLKFFNKGERILIKDELAYILNHHIDVKESMADLIDYMVLNKVSLIVPIFDDRKRISHLYLATQSAQQPLMTADQVVGLRSLFKDAGRWIIAEDKVRKSQILAGSIAHEIRNPFSKLKYQFEQIDSKVLGSDPIDLGKHNSEEIKQLHQALHESKRAVQTGTRFIDAMLSELRGESLNTERFSAHSAGELTLAAINDFSFNKPEYRQRVNVSIEDFAFWGDDTLFSFVIYNLLKNAVYYFEQYPQSKIEIGVRRQGHSNAISFTDFGPGIADTHLEQIFDDLFTQGKSSGTGLGLSYCKRVMEAFGGDIHCRSQYGKYSTFELTFPTVDEHSYETSLHAKLQPILTNKKALIIAPLTSQPWLRQALDDEFVLTVHYVTSKEQALSYLEANTVDVAMVADFEPSKASEIANAIHAVNQQSGVPTLFCTTRTEEELSYVDAFQATLFMFSKYSFWSTFAKAEQAGALKKKESLVGKKVLVVDDTHVNRLLVQSYLITEGIKVEQAASGAEAIEKAKDTAFDLIFMDIRMPNMNGFEACKEIRKFSASVPIISLSGECSPDARQSIANIMDDSIHKPADKAKLIDMLEKWCSSNKTVELPVKPLQA
ncbi:hybrid sensor histidine kinase/response regulator [Vibrio sp. 10N]|uniref:hybrid sensor histidine kinase/response regulator n=1 Tax=Vibrio sp. 10N TaxID=3058938 RepID=UPI0028138902|nr:autoinducer hybrid sensor kinase/response regulator AinR [Vibrio sp. 10N]